MLQTEHLHIFLKIITLGIHVKVCAKACVNQMITFVYYKHLFTTASDDLLNRTVCTGTPILKTASLSPNCVNLDLLNTVDVCWSVN